MPQGCRLRNAALRGCLIAGICLWAIPTLGQTQEPETKTETPTPEVQQVEPVKPAQLPLPKQEQQQPPAKQKPLCDEAEAGPESNLCQQWRVAEAAEEQVRWTSRLYYLTAWETGALVLTLLATAAAAIAAVVAAKAARAAVQVTSNTAERQLRAYVVAGTDAEWQQAYVGSSDNIVGYNFAMKWKNCGSTPARRCQTRTSLAVFDGVIPSDFDYPDKAALEITKTNHIGPSLDFRSKVGGLCLELD